MEFEFGYFQNEKLIGKDDKMKKSMIILVVLLGISSLALFADYAPSVDLRLETQIDAVSTLQVNGGTGSTVFVPGTPLSINYTYVGNQLVKMQITSANSFNLRHSLYASHNTWVIPYSMTFDFGSGTQTAVSSGVGVNLVDTNGTYNLAKNMVFSASNGQYAAGAYSDTLTFQIVAQ
jgi:hypothetical protein